MTQAQQPEALRIADQVSDLASYFGTPSHGRGVCNAAAQELRQQHARIEELEAQLYAIGAGGVEPLRKRECLHQIAEPAACGNDELRAAAQAVVDRWDTPLWKDVPATAEYINRLRSAIASTAAQPLAWQPIETAPKDGTPILAVTDEGITVIRYSMRHNDKDYWGLAVNSSYATDDGFNEASHWMPLPAAPKE